MHVDPPPGFDELLAEHARGVAALARRLRATILCAHPDLAERVYRGWHGLGFHHSRRGYVAALFPRGDAVMVGFERGADLPDPHRLLEGTGRRVRYLHFTVTGGPTDEQFVEYLDLALDQ